MLASMMVYEMAVVMAEQLVEWLVCGLVVY